MLVIKNHIHIGVSEPFCVLHASDTHLTCADERENERKLVLAEKRGLRMASAEKDLAFLREKAQAENRTIVYTGDLIDFVSELNFEKAKQFSDETDLFMVAGNHEFSLYVGEAKEDAAYRNQSLGRVQQLFRNDIRCSARMIGGVNFVGIDNSYYLIEQEQLAFLRQEAEKDAPVVLALHVPLFTEELYGFSRKGERSPASLMSVPDALMQDYEPYRAQQQRQDATTAQAYDFIMHCKNIKAVLSGHLHENFEGMLNSTTLQLVTGRSTVREICID